MIPGPYLFCFKLFVQYLYCLQHFLLVLCTIHDLIFTFNSPYYISLSLSSGSSLLQLIRKGLNPFLSILPLSPNSFLLPFLPSIFPLLYGSVFSLT